MTISIKKKQKEKQFATNRWEWLPSESKLIIKICTKRGQMSPIWRKTKKPTGNQMGSRANQSRNKKEKKQKHFDTKALPVYFHCCPKESW